MRKKQKKTFKLFFILSFIIIVSLGYFLWTISTQPVFKNKYSPISFSVEKGANLRDIATDLKNAGLIRSSYTFVLVTKLLGVDGSIQAGLFELSPSMDTLTIARRLTNSTTDIKVTIPEGKRAEEVAEILGTHIQSLSIDAITPSLIEYNGYLFPDTYNFAEGTTVDKILEVMRANFESKYQTIINKTDLSKQEIVTIASLIEREARHDEDRALVSSVIHNRYSIGMKLDIDATIQYALGYNTSQKTWWKKGLTIQDLATNSPYNTYTNAGLPPTPISNPGLAALKASANPTVSDYLYYITDKNGINRYAKNLEEHNANIRRYGL